MSQNTTEVILWGAIIAAIFIPSLWIKIPVTIMLLWLMFVSVQSGSKS